VPLIIRKPVTSAWSDNGGSNSGSEFTDIPYTSPTRKNGGVTSKWDIRRHSEHQSHLSRITPLTLAKMTEYSQSDYQRSVRSHQTGSTHTSSTRPAARPRPLSPPLHHDSYVNSVNASRMPDGAVLVKRVIETWEVKRHPATKARTPSQRSPPRSIASSYTATPSQRPRPLRLLPPASTKIHRSDRSPSRPPSTVKASSRGRPHRSPSKASSRSETPSGYQSHGLTESALGKMGGSTCSDRVGEWAGASSVDGKSSRRKYSEPSTSSRR